MDHYESTKEREATMTHILLPSDVFPPGNVGGAAWSSYTLARALIAQGHDIQAIVPTHQCSLVRPVSPIFHTYDGVPTLHYPYYVPPVPFLRNYYRHEQLWEPLAKALIDMGMGRASSDTLLIHAQHVQVMPAAIIAARHLGVPSVVTVRDHWAWDYFATGLHGNSVMYEARSPDGAAWEAVMTDLPARLGPVAGTLALEALPYILAHMRRRASFLAQADAVVAVSSYMARRLARLVSPERIVVLPNMVDIASLQQVIVSPPENHIETPFLLFVGKLEHNKGARLLMDVFRHLAHTDATLLRALPPLVVVGSGQLQAEMEQTLATLGVQSRFLSWTSHEEVVRQMARCTLLLFPSCWGEPLSRVLLEAQAVGSPVLSMPTGGTPDIIRDGVNGAIARTVEQFAQQMLTLLAHPSWRMSLGEQAQQIAHTHFSVEAVIPQVEALYTRLLAAKHGAKKPASL